ncbi:FAD-dependent oxidoreductase [bacterium]|nr:FAD-dependent oxidoreductase [bacterium]
MKYDVIVIGGGVIGVTTAYYLWKKGLEVAVIERNDVCSEETSFGNGGQISVSHAEPWAHPGAQFQVAKWLMSKDSPLYFKPQWDLHQLKWMWEWLKNCSSSKCEYNTASLTTQALDSLIELNKVVKDTKIKYDRLKKGIIHFYTDGHEYENGLEAAKLMRSYGLSIEEVSRASIVELEPSLAGCDRILGGTYAPNDESGDCNLFTKNLANWLESNGVRFFYDTAAIAQKDNLLECKMYAPNDDTRSFGLEAKQFVIAMGSYSYPFVKLNYGKQLMIYPAKGSSVTVPIIDPLKVTTISLTDDENKIVYSRLGNRLRIAGTAELAGWNPDVNIERCKVVEQHARRLFPEGCDWSKPMYWSGLRPTTPSNLPYVERLNDRVVLNTGHGTLGWTLACGSAYKVSKLI